MTESHQELMFWQNHREYVKSICDQNPSDKNLLWLNHVDIRIQNMIQNPNTKLTEKPKFGETIKKEKK